VVKTERKKPLERPRHIREDNIKMDPKEVEYGAGTGSSWLRIVRWRALVNAVMNFRVS